MPGAHFEESRPDLAPYGFTCEIWEPQPMPRADRHNELELNFVDAGALTYLLGGRRVTLPARRLSAFWAVTRRRRWLPPDARACSAYSRRRARRRRRTSRAIRGL
jgi:hypothetical protein